MVINEKGGCKGKKVARKHLTKGKNELRLSHSSNEKYAIVKRLLGNTCDVICDDGKERRCIIRGKFTGRNKRDNMIDSGAYILVGLREWVNEDTMTSGSSREHKNINFCDLLEVYNSSERDILRRTHGVFQSFKDESITGKYENDSGGSSSVAFIDQNTLKYQEMVKKMENKKNKSGNGNGSGSGSGSGDDDDNNDDDDNDDATCKEQSVVITMNIKHIGKGIISQSYDISDSEEEEEEAENEDEDEEEKEEKQEKHVNEYKNTQSHSHNHHKKNEYIHENIIDIDDI
jgi:translation initiation factor IF-1